MTSRKFDDLKKVAVFQKCEENGNNKIMVLNSDHEFKNDLLLSMLEKNNYKLIFCCITNLKEVYYRNCIKAEILFLKNTIANYELEKSNCDNPVKEMGLKITEGTIKSSMIDIGEYASYLIENGLPTNNAFADHCYFTEYITRKVAL